MCSAAFKTLLVNARIITYMSSPILFIKPNMATSPSADTIFESALEKSSQVGKEAVCKLNGVERMWNYGDETSLLT
jgi:hypothetical protein